MRFPRNSPPADSRRAPAAGARRARAAHVAAALAFALGGCSRKTATPPSASASATSPGAVAPALVPTPPPAGPVARYGYEIVATYPHDRTAFTQGLVFLKGILLESTGLYGHSTLRKVDLATGKIRDLAAINAELFAEGITVLDDKVYLLTWQSHRGFVYNLQTLAPEREFAYATEGWGLTTDGRDLIMSDGSSQLRFLDPKTFQVKRAIAVYRDGQPLNRLNELEYIHGEIYANVWQTNTIVRIDPANGRLLGLIDFSGLLGPGDLDRTTDVLNGIAYDAATDRLFVTGKNWPKLFHVRLTAQ